MGVKKGFRLELIDREMLRGRWERMVVLHSRVAFVAGPPSWMVNDEWGEKESMADANERVRDRYFNPDGSPKSTSVNNQPGVNTETVNILDSVNKSEDVNTDRKVYMKEYMKRRRAK